MRTSSFDSTPTSGTLLFRLRDTGDQQAWEEFYARYSPDDLGLVSPVVSARCGRHGPRSHAPAGQTAKGFRVPARQDASAVT